MTLKFRGVVKILLFIFKLDVFGHQFFTFFKNALPLLKPRSPKKLLQGTNSYTINWLGTLIYRPYNKKNYWACVIPNSSPIKNLYLSRTTSARVHHIMVDSKPAECKVTFQWINLGFKFMWWLHCTHNSIYYGS